MIGRAIAALAAILIAAPALADGLIDNVNGYTLDRNGQVARFNAMVIDGQGRVARLLDAKVKRPEKLDYRLDGQGRTLVPGMVDGHGHVMALGFRALQADLSRARSLGEAQAILRDWARDHPNFRWIVGSGANPAAWGLGRPLMAADLDAAVPGRPAWVEAADGQSGVANSAALAVAGINTKTPPVPGGRIAVEAGRITGLFDGAAMALVTRNIPPPQPLEREQAFAKAQELLIESGVTTVTDMGTTADDWNVMRRAGDMGRLRVRILAYTAGVDPMILIGGTGPTPWLYDGRLRMIGAFLSADGAIGPRAAWLKADYADAPRERGRSLIDDTRLRNLMSRAAMDGFQIAVEATGDAANAQALGAIEELAETYKGDRRWRIEQAAMVDPVDQPRFARNGIVASMQPALRAGESGIAALRLGPARSAGARGWAAMLGAGVPLAFGSGLPNAAPDPFPGLAAAAAGQAVPFRQLIAAYSIGAARAAFAEDRIGTLEPGRYADFLLLDRDVFTLAPADLAATRVMETWTGGKRVFVRK